MAKNSQMRRIEIHIWNYVWKKINEKIQMKSSFVEKIWKFDRTFLTAKSHLVLKNLIFQIVCHFFKKISMKKKLWKKKKFIQKIIFTKNSDLLRKSLKRSEKKQTRSNCLNVENSTCKQ